MLAFVDPGRYDPARHVTLPVTKVGRATQNALAFALSNPPQNNSRIPRIPSRRPISRTTVSHDKNDSVRPSSRSEVHKPLQASSSSSADPAVLGRAVVSQRNDLISTPARSSKLVSTSWSRSSPTGTPGLSGRASSPRVMVPSPPPLLDPRHPQGNERSHIFADTSDSEDDDGDEWRSQEYTSSIASSSEDGLSSVEDDEDEDDESDAEPWVTKDYYFPPRPVKLKPPTPRKRIALFPVATRSHKRASFKEAHARRWGALFPLEKDSIDEQNSLHGNGRLAQQQFVELVTPLVEPARILLTKEARRKQRREERKRKLALAETSPVVCSCSLKSTTTTSSSSSLSSSSLPSDSTAATSCPSCSFGSKATVSPTPISSSPPKPRRQSPVPLISKPVPLSLCPLTQHIVDLYTADQHAAALAEAGRAAAEEKAYQDSLVAMSKRPARDIKTRYSEPGVNLGVTKRASEFAGIPLGAVALVHSAYRDVLLPLTPKESSETYPTRGRSPTRRRLASAGAGHLTGGAITRAYGYRVTRAQIDVAFPPISSDDEEDPTLPELFGIPPSAVQFTTFTDENSCLVSKPPPSRGGRSPSRLPRPWGNKTRDQSASNANSRSSNSCAHRGRSASRARLQHYDPLRARPRLVADQRFLLVYALENVIRNTRHTGNDELDELGGCKSGYMGRGVLEVVDLEVGKSPLQYEWVE